jgi:hypothetical protein
MPLREAIWRRKCAECKTIQIHKIWILKQSGIDEITANRIVKNVAVEALMIFPLVT